MYHIGRASEKPRVLTEHLNMRQFRTIGIRKPKSMKGGALSNINKLEEDFAKSINFGKATPTEGSEAIKKKFSI